MRPSHLNTLGLGVVRNELLTWVFGMSITKDETKDIVES